MPSVFEIMNMIVDAAVIGCRLLLCALALDVLVIFGVVGEVLLSSGVVVGTVISVIAIVVIIETLSRDNIHSQVRNMQYCTVYSQP